MEITQIPVGKIDLDERNPRIAHAMEGITGAVNQDWITLALGHAAPEDEHKADLPPIAALRSLLLKNRIASFTRQWISTRT